MAETTTDVRADIEQTRARMSGAIAELGRKVDLTQKVRDHPWAAVGIAFGAGVALSASRADVRAARVAADATKATSSKLGTALLSPKRLKPEQTLATLRRHKHG